MHGGVATVSRRQTARPATRRGGPGGRPSRLANLAAHVADRHRLRHSGGGRHQPLPRDDQDSEIAVVRERPSRPAPATRWWRGALRAGRRGRARNWQKPSGPPRPARCQLSPVRAARCAGCPAADRGDRDAGLRRGRGRLLGRGGQAAARIERLGLRRSAGLHGEDAAVAQPRSHAQGPADGLPIPIRDARLFAGAGFVTAYCGDMLMMPGLPSQPSGEHVDIDERGETVGLF